MFLRTKKLDSNRVLSKHFTPYQLNWIQAETPFHDRRQRVMALAEKSVRIGWTYADAFKNVRKRLWFRDRDYLFATKDYSSALEYVRQCYQFAEIFNLTHTVLRHGEESLQVHPLDEEGRPTAFTQDVKVGVIKFDNGSRIIAFSANPQAMAVYGGDVGLDEFAKHPNARLLWETAQGRITWGYDLAVWSSHDGEDTLFSAFAREARVGQASRLSSSYPLLNSGNKREVSGPDALPSSVDLEGSTEGIDELGRGVEGRAGTGGTPVLRSPWNVYFRVSMSDAINQGLVELVNRARGTSFSREGFFTDCRSRAREEGIFEQAYMCNPLGASANHIVDWSVIERCRYDYEIVRVHLEHKEIVEKFGEFRPGWEQGREDEINEFIHKKFLKLFQNDSTYRLGFDVAASGQGNLAAIYIDERSGDDLWLRALFTCRTEDWHFLKTVLFAFLRELRSVQAVGDETGLGKQICWEARYHFGGRFQAVNFSSKKHDIGFSLMNQISVTQKRFPRSHQDIAADYFALRKSYHGTRWVFSEGPNNLNPASHCDIAWAGALATEAHINNRCEVWALVG